VELVDLQATREVVILYQKVIWACVGGTQQIMGRNHHCKCEVVLKQPAFLYKYWDVKQRSFCPCKKNSQINHIILLVLFAFIWKQKYQTQFIKSRILLHCHQHNPHLWSWQLFYQHYEEVSSSSGADFNLYLKYGSISELWDGMIDTASNMVLESRIWKHC